MLKGGSPLSNDESVFSFELNESLFFEKGQEVAEMRGISLDPEITIQTYNDYISIVGKIELQGEFEKIVSTEQEQITDFTDYQAKRYVEKVVDTVNNVAAFSHRFPVEISVPAYRVTDINDITVNIEAFDYEIPDPSQLKLYSTIEIQGINSEIEAPFARKAEKELEEEALEEEASLDETLAEDLNEIEDHEEEIQERETQEEDHKLEVQEESREQDHELHAQEESREQDHESREQEEIEGREEAVEVGDSFQFEMKEKQQKESADAVELLNTDHPPALPAEMDTVVEAEEEQDEVDPDRWKYKETKTLAEFFKKLPSQEPEEDLSEITDIPSPSPSVDVEATEQEEESSERVEGVTYLSDMFREPEERQYTKMKLCIVQDQDTIESIAERYHISALQLIKQNHLDEDYNIEEGQLLNIPMQKEK